MHWDEHRRIHWSPREFYDLASDHSRRVISRFLVTATPHAFPSYDAYHDFLEDVSERFNVPPQGIVLRGSCLIGFSIKPDNEKLWQSFDDDSDLDVALVDAALYDDSERKVRQWERMTRAGNVPVVDWDRFKDRQRDRYYRLCRMHDLPGHLTGHYRDATKRIADRCHSGPWREVKLFLFRDWWALRARNEFDFRKLRQGVDAGILIEPGDSALPRLRPKAPPSSA